jgi:23S rRNA (guanosine2251-2'-O)-methyltransferase
MEHLEGRTSVMAALAAGQRRFQVILIRQGIHEERVRDVIALAESRGVPVRYADARELEALAHGGSHGGVVAICTAKPRLPAAELERMVARLIADAGRGAGDAPLLLLLEGVDDARNLGFTLRSAEAFGAHAVLIKKHIWEFDPVEIARPASGAYERLPLAQIEDAGALVRLQRAGVRLVGCLASARRTIHDVNLSAPVCLAIGGEKRGLSGAVRALCDVFVRIPTRGGASSLSLSHAASVVLAEAMRQRISSAQSTALARGSAQSSALASGSALNAPDIAEGVESS